MGGGEIGGSLVMLRHQGSRYSVEGTFGSPCTALRRMGSISEMLTVVPIHQRPDLLEPCADLINEEWKRSRTSRIHSLQRSTHDFPLCLVLIRTPRAEEKEAAEGKLAKNQCQLLGHASLSRVVGHPQSLFVETVVVPKAIRGKGYGRKLMEAVESYAKARGYSRLHLTTHDKQYFYAHLGYTLSKPVQHAGFVSALIPKEFLEIFSPPQHGRELPARPGGSNPGASYGSKVGAHLHPLPPSVASFSSSVSSVALPPPPPPPHPGYSPDSGDVTISPPPQLAASSHSAFPQPINAPFQPSESPSVPLSANSFSAATLPPPPPPLLPPPPPPLPPPPELPPVTHMPGLPSSCQTAASCPPEGKSQNQTFQETPYRDLRGRPIFWMEKAI